MTQIQAKLFLYQKLSETMGERYFNYVFFDEDSQETSSFLESKFWNISFNVGQPLKHVIITLTFYSTFVEVLTFPHPRIIKEKAVLEMVKFANYLNFYIRPHDGNGRFFVDEKNLDIAYCTRLNYSYFEFMPEESIRDGVLGVFQFLKDIDEFIYYIGKGIMKAEKGYEHIDKLWGKID